MPDILKITLGNTDPIALEFDLINSPITDLWIERMSLRESYGLDDPTRFYGFNDPEQELTRAESMMRGCITIINSYQPIINREFASARDQDTLNYLHHIFEVYHGLLDQQTTEWWTNAPNEVRRALADLNLAVHRCESATRLNRPRMVCTWFGIPKDRTLSQKVMTDHGTLVTDFGGVYLNYAEIGKTVKDLTTDNDNYIHDDAFKPFEHYSADFVVYFFDVDQTEVQQDLAQMSKYIQEHQDFFSKKGITSVDDPRANPLKFKVAQLRYQDQQTILDLVRANQYVKQVELI